MALLQINPDPIFSRTAVLKTACPWHLLTGADSVFLWRGMRGHEVWLGLGCLEEHVSPAHLRAALSRVQAEEQDLPPRGFGVVAFDSPQPMSTPWRGFPAQRFVLPKCVVCWRAGVATVIVLASAHERLPPELRRVTALLQHPPHSSPADDDAVEECSLFASDAWRKAVATIKDHIRYNRLQKVVLARQTVLRFEHELNAVALVERLAADAPDSVLFAYRQRAGGVFLGATPERLFVQQRRELAADSLAGTRPRGNGAVEDQSLALELTHSAKDLLEQQLVTEHLVQQMQTICEDVVIEAAPRIRKLDTVQHLASTVEGTVRERITLDRILNSLHPTPATCGYPIAEARELIAALEPEPRGLYAGAIGWIAAEHAEFAVAIRSGLIQHNEARLFAGAGIMAASEADAEYEECEWKLLPLRRALLSPCSRADKGRLA